ncbi:patatin-like phospholipase family protein [Moraxella canis]|uniref:Patatin-like phospholipase family protein n=1 Tax=Moraxella canis TaxID=90239 RepID=A0ABZ0WVD7_9GAMM|nr:patatin-like phospholipase family protein [Moraxella canis]WQE03212.1 patatin-like phospholipase family protein [Moraxella canis]
MRLAVAAVPVFALILTACGSTTPPSTAQVSATPKADEARPVVALVLGGGGTRGFAHIGAIESLEAHGIRPDMVVGTSAGALVGAVYASGKTPSELIDLADAVKETDLIEITPSQQGLIDGTRLRRYVNEQVNHRPIEAFPMRYAAVATQMHTNTAVTFRTGEAGLAVQASSSVPKLFIPPRIPETGGEKYVDGSQVALLPTRIAKSLGADVIIAVDVMGERQAPDSNTPHTQGSSINIQRNETGISAKWGDKTMTVPIDIDKLNDAAKGLPVDMPLGDLLGAVMQSIPANTDISLPRQLPANASEFSRWFGNLGANLTAEPEDVRAADVLIRPKTTGAAVFDSTDRTRLINEGRLATDAQITAIKQAIEDARALKHAQIQTTQ